MSIVKVSTRNDTIALHQKLTTFHSAHNWSLVNTQLPNPLDEMAQSNASNTQLLISVNVAMLQCDGGSADLLVCHPATAL